MATGSTASDEGLLLEIRDLQAGYGDIPVLWDISLQVRANEIVGLIGSNGAGKSTLINVISGIVPIDKGALFWRGREIGPCTPKERVELGIVQIPEGRLLFSGLTVEQNLMLGAFSRKDRENFDEDLKAVYGLFPRLEERKAQMAGTLSGGEQQMCAIGRGLMSNPKLLLIDELSLGLAPILVDQIMDALRRAYQERDISIMLVEQDVHLGLSMSNRAYVLETGHIVREDRSELLARDPEIRRAYLGI
jgi:branched-chain amino acid transport system ATP-binding protein